jgi:hypothetical protein
MPVSQNRSATNAADSRCDQLADSPDDPAKIGNGVPIDQINVAFHRFLATKPVSSETHKAERGQIWRP